MATIGAGLLAEAIGLRATALLAPIGGLIGAAILFAGPVRKLVRLPTAPSDRGTRRSCPGQPSAAEVVVEIGRDEPIGG